MESFTIQCTSCESKIRVRNPNMIGQIANCPKCGSMILIAAPQQITVESGNPTDSVAMTREALPPPDESTLKSPSSFETGFRIDGLPAGYSQSVDAVHSQPPEDEYRLAADPTPEQNSSDALPLGAWLPDAAQADPLPPPRNDIDASIQAVRAKRQESAAKSRNVMLVATIGLCSVLVAIGILVTFLRWYNQPKVVAQNKPPVAVNKPALDPAADPAAEQGEQNANGLNSPPGDAQTVPPTELPPTQLPLAGNSEGNATNNKPPNDASSDPPTEGTATLPDSSQMPAPPQPNTTEQPTANPAANPTTMGNAASTKTPIGSSIAPSLDSVLGGPTNSQPTGDVPADLPPGLQTFSNLFSQSFDPVMTDTALPLEKATEVPDDAGGPAAQPNAPAQPAVDLVPPTVDKMLNIELAGLRINKRPLSEALTTLSLVGEVPIVADLDALMVVGVTKSTLVEVTATSTTKFDALLKSVASSTKIQLVPWENRVIYARVSDEDLESHLPGALPISDLVADQQQSAQLLQCLKEVLPELGDALQFGDQGLQLALTKENRLTWFQVARLLETWRAARGISNPSTSAVVPKNCLLPAWPVAAMQQVAKTPIKQVVPSEPIARSWQRITAEARVACWIDWYGLQMGETNPRQKATVITAGRSLGEVLQHYANKYQAVFAIEDARAIWVTSPEMHRNQPRLYVLPLSERSMEEWNAELEPLAPYKSIPSPDGQYLFVRCSRPILVEPN